MRSALHALAVEKGLEFVATVPEDTPLVYGDSGRIMQCLINLAGNSLKFTKAGKVEISVGHREGTLTCCVSDTGVGIPPDKIGSLFTEFKQTDASIASEYGGTGLGLSITKKFIEMHGGRIWVESEVGQGSRFIFSSGGAGSVTPARDSRTSAAASCSRRATAGVTATGSRCSASCSPWTVRPSRSCSSVTGTGSR